MDVATATATAADALAALASSLPDDSRYLVAKRLTDLRHEKAAEVLCDWIDTYRAGCWGASYRMMDLMMDLLLVVAPVSSSGAGRARP